MSARFAEVVKWLVSLVLCSVSRPEVSFVGFEIWTLGVIVGLLQGLLEFDKQPFVFSYLSWVEDFRIQEQIEVSHHINWIRILVWQSGDNKSVFRVNFHHFLRGRIHSKNHAFFNIIKHLLNHFLFSDRRVWKYAVSAFTDDCWILPSVFNHFCYSRILWLIILDVLLYKILVFHRFPWHHLQRRYVLNVHGCQEAHPALSEILNRRCNRFRCQFEIALLLFEILGFRWLIKTIADLKYDWVVVLLLQLLYLLPVLPTIHEHLLHHVPYVLHLLATYRLTINSSYWVLKLIENLLFYLFWVICGLYFVKIFAVFCIIVNILQNNLV